MHKHYVIQGRGQYLGKDERLHDLRDLSLMTPEPMASYPTAKAAHAATPDGMKPEAIMVEDDACKLYCTACGAAEAQCGHGTSNAEIMQLAEHCPWTFDRYRSMRQETR